MTPESEALICAQASEAAYGTAESCRAAMAALGLVDFAWVDLTTTFEEVCAFVASGSDVHLLAFRGTKSFRDWMTDLACTPVRFDWVFTGAPVLGEIHAGFGHCLADGLNDIEAALVKRDPAKPLLITGHSLGGALAALAGAYFTVAGKSVPAISRIYTFGQPRIGLHSFCNTYSRILAGRLIRFVNRHDIVPRVPLRGFDYGDEGTMIHFDSSGTPMIQSPEWRSFLARAFQSLDDVIREVENLGVDIGEHSVSGYRELVNNTQPQLGVLLHDACRD